MIDGIMVKQGAMMPEIFEWKFVAGSLFAAAWSCIGIYIARSLNEMKDSVQSLNVNVAVVIEKVSNHERRIERLEDEYK